MGKKYLRGMILAGLSAGLLACQAAVREGTPPASQPALPTAAAPTGYANTQPPETSGSGLAGQVIAESDVSGQADEPLAGQMVLAIPWAQAAEILGPGAETFSNEKLRFLHTSLLEANPAAAVTVSDAGGNYSLTLPPGKVILCLAESESTPPNFPATTRGCGWTEVHAGAQRQVDISSGFGEILLVEP